MDRRTALRRGLVVGAAGLAGCNDLLGSGQSTEHRPGTTESPSNHDGNPSDGAGIRAVFERQFPASDGVGAFEDVTVIDDGGYVLVGTQTTPSGGSRGWITRTDAQGQERWGNTYGSGAAQLHGVTIAADGDVLAVGRRGNQTGRARAWALRLSPDGRERWSRTYEGANDPIFQAVAPAPNGFVLAGVHEMTTQGGGSGWLLAVDGNGKVVDDRVFESGYYRLFNDVVRTGQGSYALVGSASDRRDGTSSGFLVGIDADGKTRFERQFSAARQNVFRAGVARPDGGLLCCGETSPAPAGRNSGEDAWLVAVDPSGREQWSTSRDDLNGDRLWDVATAADGSALAVGQTNGTGQGTRTGLLLSVAADGTVRSVRTTADLRGSSDSLAALTGVAADGDDYVASGLQNVGGTDADSAEGRGWLLKISA
ncbi:hypothetical protein ACFR9U_10150 [Halorientalis brevis]|uniref:Uncharacterized protein n=1 Tax=Halorientalis brevis TaxID=1126241 RepID=A0ABD6CBN5_9EURY|nr:hypothetical protein [Halorientalis brevis]